MGELNNDGGRSFGDNKAGEIFERACVDGDLLVKIKMAEGGVLFDPEDGVGRNGRHGHRQGRVASRWRRRVRG